MSAAQGYATQLGIDTVNPVTKRFDFEHESLALGEIFKDTNGLRGTRSRDVSRVRQGNRPCSGSIFLQPNAAELALLLPWILGGTPSGSGTVTYPLGDALTAYYVSVDRVTKVFTYDGVKVDRATFRASQGEPLSLELDLVGIDETPAAAGSFPSLALNVANGPFMFTDMSPGPSFSGTQYQAREMELVIDNRLDRDRFFTSQTITAVNPTDRLITVRTSLPYGDASAVYGTGASGIPVICTFTNVAAIFTLSMVKVCFPRKSPVVEGRREVMLALEGQAYKSGGTLELIASLNPGP